VQPQYLTFVNNVIITPCKLFQDSVGTIIMQVKMANEKLLLVKTTVNKNGKRFLEHGVHKLNVPVKGNFCFTK